MRTAPPIAKVTCPTSTGYFPRHRLYRLLDKARKAPVLWITGPPGCGKTALISSYIESRHLPCLWYKVDEADADLSTFFYYLGLAAAKAAPRKRRRLPLLTPERMPGLSVFAQRYFEDLSSMLPVPSLLVYQLLGYLTWRDCKAALLVFNKHNAKFSEVLEKIPDALQSHLHFLKDMDHSPAGEWRYLFRSMEDEARLVTVHVFAFNLYVDA